VKKYLDELPGKPVQSIWTDLIPPRSSRELTGFPTQKPEKLLERIIRASSNPGDLVADFFCGSGTTLVVGEKLGRRWLGCDSSKVAIQIAKERLFKMKNPKAFEVLG
jgi:adenine-specific DNA-methyltransferase